MMPRSPRTRIPRRCLIVERHEWETGASERQLQFVLELADAFFGPGSSDRDITVRVFFTQPKRTRHSQGTSPSPGCTQPRERAGPTGFQKLAASPRLSFSSRKRPHPEPTTSGGSSTRRSWQPIFMAGRRPRIASTVADGYRSSWMLQFPGRSAIFPIDSKSTP